MCVVCAFFRCPQISHAELRKYTKHIVPVSRVYSSSDLSTTCNVRKHRFLQVNANSCYVAKLTQLAQKSIIMEAAANSMSILYKLLLEPTPVETGAICAPAAEAESDVFSWSHYLIETCSRPAPARCFRQSVIPPVNEFKARVFENLNKNH